ncbi:MAG: alpha-L-fucosidase [Spirochaetales bacterium]|nr:alpha-L-fucosidase [Spirochaetales bacterium]
MTSILKNLLKPEERLSWYKDAKFGLFIHWGAYSVAGVEASWPVMAPDLSEVMFNTQTRITEKEYELLPAEFNPVNFDAEEWVRIAADAGMRYIVFTAKHHDGFCMFDAPGTDYKITNTPYGKDICLELAEACRKAGMPLGFYYSPPDMHHSGYRNTGKPVVKNWTGEPKRKVWGDYLAYMESHIRKLLTDYGDVKILWFDGLASHGKYDPPRFHKLIHELSPATLINDRLGDGFDFVTPEQFIPKTGIPARTGKPPSGLDPDGDGFYRLICFLFKIPGIKVWIRKQMRKYGDGTLELTPVHQETYPAPEQFQPWETCMTMGDSWAYKSKEKNWKEPAKLVRNLIEVVSRGGNYLLNIGPDSSGRFPPEAVERLEYVSIWLKKYGKSMYGSTYTPLYGQGWGQATHNDDKVFLHISEWPESRRLEIKSFPVQVKSAALFGGESLKFSQKGENLEISLPGEAPDKAVSVVALEIEADGRVLGEYSPVVETRTKALKYARKQAITSAVINSSLNFLIAFFTYRSRGALPYGEAAVDILISTGIISFLTSWILISSARKEFTKGNLIKTVITRLALKLPKSEALGALFITIICVILFGGVFMSGLIYLISPAGLSNWAYIIIKTLYTGAAGGLAALFAIRSVANDEVKLND